MVDDLASSPSYVNITSSGNAAPYAWQWSSSDPRALQKPSSAGDRVAASWLSFDSFSLSFNFTDQQAHQVALYFMDWDSLGRVQRVDILDAYNNVVDSRTVSNFGGGQYWVWNLSGHVTVRITNASPYNAVLSGIFFR